MESDSNGRQRRLPPMHMSNFQPSVYDRRNAERRRVRDKGTKRNHLVIKVTNQVSTDPSMQEAGYQGDGKETEVTWDDQQNINKFGRLNNKFHELEDEIKATKEMSENLEDAGNELILSDEEEVRYLIGEVFSHIPRDEVENRLDIMKEENEKELERLLEEKESIISQMAELKKILYGKFKDSINLEEE